MRRSVRTVAAALLAVGGAGVWLTHALGQPEREPPRGLDPRDAPPGCLQVVANPGEPMAAVVYDPQQQVLGVYHVDRKTGAIELKSIRQIQWDLQMQHYNGVKPLPAAIRDGLAP